MKRIICILFAALTLFSLAACSDSGSSSSAPSVDTQKATEAVETALNTSKSAADTTDTQSKTPSSDGVDVDLTAMSTTMIYSEVLNMQQHPDDYLGKTVKMKGAFTVSEIDDNRYFACIIKDATACCAQGIEFTWAGDHTYPDDYPPADTEITVFGTFNTYMEGTNQYLQLKDSEVQF
ncbi:MAG: hypothetical protein IJG87_10205 [Ruminococcus sp.]|nr:hypothetical protein [Ruminococcus sp.]